MLWTKDMRNSAMNKRSLLSRLFRNWTRNQKLLLASIIVTVLTFVVGLFCGQKAQKIEIVNPESIGTAIADRLTFVQMQYLDSSTNLTVVEGRRFDGTNVDAYT